jgi:hypothetical protein
MINFKLWLEFKEVEPDYGVNPNDSLKELSCTFE